MRNNNYNNDTWRNLELNGISQEIHGVKKSIKDMTYLQAYGKEAYIEMIEKRRFYKSLIWYGIASFIVGFTLVGLFLNGWSMSAFINKLVDLYFNMF